MIKTEKWCWGWLDAEELYGQYPTREDAIRGALEESDWDDPEEPLGKTLLIGNLVKPEGKEEAWERS